MWSWVAAGGAFALLVAISGRRRKGARAEVGAMGDGGTQIANDADKLSTDQERQEHIFERLADGEVPSWNGSWKTVTYTAADKNGVNHTVEMRVAPDYLAVGTDADPLTAVLGYPNALRVAEPSDFVLPTSLVVDKVWASAEKRYDPAPLPPTSGSTMRKPPYWLTHRENLTKQGWPAGDVLQAGHKKDVVVTKQLVGKPGRLAIYGWHKSDGKAIQPVSLFHGADYADYSHGIRAVAPQVLVDGAPMDYRDLLKDPVLWPLVSKEGAYDYDAVTAHGPMAWNML